MQEKLKKYVEQFEQIIIWEITSIERWMLFASFVKSNALQLCSKQILILYTSAIKDGGDLFEDRSAEGGVEIREISSRDYNEIWELYSLYEFSDKIHIITDFVKCGCLLNYLRTGIMTEQEFFASLLHLEGAVSDG